MKYNLQLQNIRKNQKLFLDIIQDLIDQDISLQIEILSENEQTSSLIRELEIANFINLDAYQKVPLNEFAQIFKDQEIHTKLKEFVKQKLSLDNEIQWILDENHIITDLNCKPIIEDFLHGLFYCKTTYKCYAEFLAKQPNLKMMTIAQQQRSLKGYKNGGSKQQDDVFLIYGEKVNNINIFDKFQQKIVKHEHKVELFNIFTEFYMAIFQYWIQKYYVVYLEILNEKEIFLLYGPHAVVSEVEEIILREYNCLRWSCSPIKSEGLTKDQFIKLQLNEYLQQTQMIEFEENSIDNPKMVDLNQSLKAIRKQTFQAVMFAEFEEESLNQTLISFNFDFNSKIIEQQMEMSALKLAKTNKKGVCVVYFVIVYGQIHYSLLKKSINEYLKVSSDMIYDPNLTKYLSNLEFEDVIKFEEDFKVSLDLSDQKISVTGKQHQIDKFKECISNMVSYKTEIIEFYQYRTSFNLRAAMLDYKEKYDLMVQQNDCQVIASLDNTRIQLRGNQKNIIQLKSELLALEKEIESSKIVKQIQIELPKEIKVKNLINSLQGKYRSTDIVQGECEGLHLIPLYEFKRKQTRIKICEGSPLGLFDIRAELLKLDSSLFIIPVEKIHDDPQIPKYLWEQQIVKKRSIDLCSVSENRYYKMHKFRISFPEIIKEKKPKDKKSQILTIEFSICYLYYKEYSNPQNYIDYFDKETLNKSMDNLLIEVKKEMPLNIFLSCSNEPPFNIQNLAIDLQFPKLNIYFIMNELEQLDSLRIQIKYFDEEESRKQKITQHFSIISCILDNVEKVINELNSI